MNDMDLIQEIPDAKYRLPALFSFLGLFVAFAVSSVLCSLVLDGEDTLMLFFSMVPMQLICLAITLLTLIPLIRKFGFFQALGIRRDMPPMRKCIAHIIITLLIIYPLISVATAITTWFCEKLNISIIEQSFAILPENPSPLYTAILIFGCTVLAPLTEELLMRLVLFRATRSFWKNGATCFTAAVFALAHGCPQLVPGLFIVGLALQIAKRKGGLPLSILLHSMFNGISLIAMNMGE